MLRTLAPLIGALEGAMLVLAGARSALGLLLGSLFIAGCGEAVFFENVRLSDKGSILGTSSILTQTATDLGYIACNGNRQEQYCAIGTGYTFTVTESTDKEFAIEFESFGVPHRQKDARNDFATALKRQCNRCEVYVRDHSIWGFRKDDSGWRAF